MEKRTRKMERKKYITNEKCRAKLRRNMEKIIDFSKKLRYNSN